VLLIERIGGDIHRPFAILVAPRFQAVLAVRTHENFRIGMVLNPTGNSRMIAMKVGNRHVTEIGEAHAGRIQIGLQGCRRGGRVVPVSINKQPSSDLTRYRLISLSLNGRGT